MTFKRLVFLSFSFMLAVPMAAHAGWTEVFDDEFTGTALNTNYWIDNYIYSGETENTLPGNGEQEVYVDANRSVGGGHLNLTATALGGGEGPETARFGGKYQSGMIRSTKTFYYGYFEAKVKLPNALGVWPAFWLNSDYDAEGNLGWPPEIDAFEFVNNGKEDTVDMIHSGVVVQNGVQGGQLVYHDANFHTDWTYYQSKTDLTADWHTVGLMWTPTTVTVYMDGLKLYTKDYKWVYSNGTLAGPAHILLNLAIGGTSWAGRHGVDDAAFPQTFEVEYVRVYQYDKNSTTVPVLPNIPDLASYSYDTPYNDMPKIAIHPVAVTEAHPLAGKSTQILYELDTIPTTINQKLRVGLVDATTGHQVLEEDYNLPTPTTGGAAHLHSSVTLNIPSNIPSALYEIRMALTHPVYPNPKTPTAYYLQNIPLEGVAGTKREHNNWYDVGVIRVMPKN